MQNSLMIDKNSDIIECTERPCQIKPKATKFQQTKAEDIKNKKVKVKPSVPRKRRKKQQLSQPQEPKRVYRQKGPLMTHLNDEEYIEWLRVFLEKLKKEDDELMARYDKLVAEGKSPDPAEYREPAILMMIGFLYEAELEFAEEEKEKQRQKELEAGKGQDTPEPVNEEESFSYIKTKHSFHLVDPSPWPILASLGVLMLTTGFVSYMQKFVGGGLLLLTGLVLILLVMFVWWRDIIREATFEGQHSFVVQRGLRLGMILFIVSEIMFFFAFFWAFFHSSLSPTFNIGGVWPPLGISPIKTLGIPLTNTFFLLTSGATVTWAHHSLLARAKRHSLVALILTITLAFLFTSLQVLEYFDAPFNISDSVFGSCFYLTTGFHGFHVFVGAIALFVSLVRIVFNHYTDTHHFGLESGIWYWHFVDVVWLFLFVTVYWWGGKI